MAILAALVALGSRFATKILTTALGWASTLLFGRVPASRQILLLGVTFGSVIWMVLVAGVLVPQVGTFLLFLIPPQDIVPEGVVRLGMLIGALVLPAVIGGLTLALSPDQERGARAVFEAVLRGYPLTVLLAILLVFLAGLAIWRKAGALIRHWDDAHVPLVVKPGAYEQVATDLRRAVVDAGLEVESRPASAAMSKPAKWIAAVGGRSSSSLVPDRMLQLRGKDIDILIYPMDLLISGKPELLARARAAMASRLTTTAAHLTVSAESQAIEDRLTALATGSATPPERPKFDDDAAAALEAIDGSLATLVVPYDEWEVLYRQRLQVERDLRAGAMAGEAIIGAATPAAEGIQSTAAKALREGADLVLDAATDERTTKALDRLAGTEIRLGVLVAAMAASAVSFIVRGGLRQRRVRGGRASGADDDLADEIT